MMYIKNDFCAFEESPRSDKIAAVLKCVVDSTADLPMNINIAPIVRAVQEAGLATTDSMTMWNEAIRAAAVLIAEEPEYSFVAAKLLSEKINLEFAKFCPQRNFAAAVAKLSNQGILSQGLNEFVQAHSQRLQEALKPERDALFEYFGLQTLSDRYLLKCASNGTLAETPQHFFMRIACGVTMEIEEAIEFYNLMSKFEYFPSSPTMFNAGTNHSQLSSCYLVDSPADDLADIYRVYGDIAQLSKFAGGIGVAFHRVRSKNSKIKSTQGRSNGIVPFLKTLDASVNAVNQGGKRKGACCVYLEPWHDDIFEFLALKENTGDEARRTHNLNIANWIPDIFMERVENDGMWSLFSPQDVPEFPDLFGDDFTQAYVRAEAQGIAKRSVKARELFAAMMRTLAQTGNGWMGFKDTSNLKANQTLEKNNIIHHSNLCTEILEVTSAGETAVCNLGSINLARFTEDQTFQFAKLSTAVKKIVRYLDKTIDINFYPITTARTANEKWRPIGLGIMGLHELFLQLSLPFDSQEAKELSTKIQEEIYAAAIEASIELSQEFGPHPAFAQTRAAQGLLQPHLWGIKENPRFNELGAKAKEFGLRNSLLIAIAPTATIAAIAGTTECIEPLVANFFKRETLSGEFLQINKYLVKELRKLGLWKNDIKEKLKRDDGSIARIEEIPAGLKRLFRTAWEIPMRALIDMAAARGPFIDQSQSLNLFAENPDIGRLSSMYFYTWKAGLKTTYYLRSRAATKIMKTTVSSAEAKRCSLENPGHCEACQ